MRASVPIVKDVVLVGAGHAHVGVLRRFGMRPMPGVRLTLVTRQVDTPYSGMLPGLIAGHYTADEAHIDTGPLCRFAGARLYQSQAIGLDPAGKRVICDNRPAVPYDVVSIDIGSTPGARQLPGVAEHAVPVKPVDGFLARFEAARRRVLAAGGRARIGVVGAGAGGVELLLAIQCRLVADVAAAGLDVGGLKYSIVTSGGEILDAMPRRVRQRFTEILRARGVAVVTNRRVTAVEPGTVIVDGGERIALDEVFWTTRAEPAAWLADTGLDLDGGGFIRVSDTLQSTSHPDVFAAGDVAAIEGYDLPKSGVYAVRSGKPLATNIRRRLQGAPLTRYRPQRHAMYLISTGDRRAIGTRNGITFEGAWVWRWKDWIDQRFMSTFRELPEMSRAASEGAVALAEARARPVAGTASRPVNGAAPADQMRCGGCGAKVGASVLSRALAGIEAAPRPDVLIGLDAPDDAAVVDTGGDRLSVYTVDYFRAIVDDPYQFGRIAANHALGDIFAMGAEPRTALAIATVPHGIEGKVEADLGMLMAGANEMLRAADCALVGGHTSEGAELALGFSVTGSIERGKVLRKGGMRPGDVLILTKPLGTGALLAADMRGRARARWVMAAIGQMTTSNRAGAEILAAHSAHAMTDVTGFGLVGHLLEMVEASGVDVTLDLPAVPLLDGVRETLAAGIVSSLFAQNAQAASAIRNLELANADPAFPVLFDPQTAGGLIASVPAAKAASCIAALTAAGYAKASVVGTVEARSGSPRPIDVKIGD